MAEAEAKKVYTKEEIAKLAPGYRGNPENFDPSKKGRKSTPKQKSNAGPKTADVTPS